jgi:3-deoxy-manno-octulosonate cytidylyltransferase (CMP-KDO synthetase)
LQDIEQNKIIRPIIIIPSRLESTRLPKKALKLINGKPMIWHVWSNATKANVAPVLVATDSKEIKDIITENDGNAIITNKEHTSGSDRVYEALTKYDTEENYNTVVNLQGDMPFFDPNLLKTLLSKIGNEDIATLVCEATSSEIIDPNVVKAVISWDGEEKDHGSALYFSRSSVPYNAEFYWHHIGIYAWKRHSLKNFISLAPSQLELIEKLEQLRALENGMIIKAIKVDENPIGVDTQSDLNRIKKLMENKSESKL